LCSSYAGFPDPLPQRNTGSSGWILVFWYTSSIVNDQRGPLVDIALRLNVVVVCAVFVFVGAILLGVF
jgi:hypothetical protein